MAVVPWLLAVFLQMAALKSSLETDFRTVAPPAAMPPSLVRQQLHFLLLFLCYVLILSLVSGV